MNARGIQVTLPPPAQLRLNELNIQRDSALDQASALPLTIGFDGDPDPARGEPHDRGRVGSVDDAAAGARADAVEGAPFAERQNLIVQQRTAERQAVTDLFLLLLAGLLLGASAYRTPRSLLHLALRRAFCRPLAVRVGENMIR
jgi:hypothetical protein